MTCLSVKRNGRFALGVTSRCVAHHLIAIRTQVIHPFFRLVYHNGPEAWHSGLCAKRISRRNTQAAIFPSNGLDIPNAQIIDRLLKPFTRFMQ